MADSDDNKKYKIYLKEKPKPNPLIIEGFPGFGLVGTIATEFLIDHLNTKLIGKIFIDEIPPMTAIHDGKIVQPIGIFYDSKNNIVILHVITNVQGFEWQLADAVVDLAKQFKAKEILSIEGVGSMQGSTDSRAFYFTNVSSGKGKFDKMGIAPLREGIVVGVTGTLLIKAEDLPMTCVFAETHSGLPDSKAAAKVIEVIDKYIGLNVDYKPLLKQAEQFEDKIKGIMLKSQEAGKEQEMKKLSYLG